MTDHRSTTSIRAKHDRRASEIIDIYVGPRLQFITPQRENGDDYCLVKVEIPAGITVPVHSHPDRETFYVLSGELQGNANGGWQTFQAGDVFDVADGVKHAIRNAYHEPLSLLMVTTSKLGQFFRDVGRPFEDAPLPAPTAADFERFTSVASAYGYWMGGPADNAEYGIDT
ncbi:MULTISPECIES: cupin domain-containing protein [unclassified Rhizobium]